jgi:hypothetical protein
MRQESFWSGARRPGRASAAPQNALIRPGNPRVRKRTGANYDPNIISSDTALFGANPRPEPRFDAQAVIHLEAAAADSARCIREQIIDRATI